MYEMCNKHLLKDKINHKKNNLLIKKKLVNGFQFHQFRSFKTIIQNLNGKLS